MTMNVMTLMKSNTRKEGNGTQHVYFKYPFPPGSKLPLFSSPKHTSKFWTSYSQTTRSVIHTHSYADFSIRHHRPQHPHILRSYTHSPTALTVSCPRQKETVSPPTVDYSSLHRHRPSSTMDQSSAAACSKSPSACSDGDKVKKADDASSYSCPSTTNAPVNTECDVSSPPGVNQDRTLSVATEDSRRTSTGDVDEQTKPACEKKAACDAETACQKESSPDDKPDDKPDDGPDDVPHCL